MAAVTTAPQATGAEPSAERAAARHDRLRGAFIAAGAVVATIVFALIPLINNHYFYYDNDTASQQIPMFFRIGTLLRGGTFPVLYDPGSWAGGNLSAEAQFGIFSPITAVTQVLTSYSPDVLVAATLLKLAYLGFLTLGFYLLAREYGTPRWAAFALAVALPFAGYTRYFDSSTWMTGLIAYAWVPHVWWSMRKAGRGRINPLWAFLIGACAVTVGNPYGLLACVIVIIGLLVEYAVRRDRAALLRIVLTGACIGLIVPLVFLPLTGAGSVSIRQGLESVGYTGALAPNVGDFLAMSSPTYAPLVKTFSTVPNGDLPISYLSWFVLPLLPWLKWRSTKLRTLVGPLTITLLFLVMALGPSELWLFRWPVRIVQPGYLGVALLFAIVLGHGLRTDNVRRRALASGAIVAAGAYLAWARQSGRWHWQALALLTVALLVAAAVAAARRGVRQLSGVLVVGTALVILLQSAVYPVNNDVANWRLPHNVAAMRKLFRDYKGETLQLTTPETMGSRNPATFREILPGSAFLPSGVHMVNSYNGVGFQKFVAFFCMHYLGDSCRIAYFKLWQPTELGNRTMAQLLRLQTVVVDNKMPFKPIFARPGWRIVKRDRVVTVLTRTWPATRWTRGELSYASAGVRVTSDVSSDSDRAETVRLQGSDTGGTLAFARLAWPGYTATLNGKLLRIHQGPAGVLTVHIPPGTGRATLFLHFAPPRYKLTIVAALVGTLGALLIGAVEWGRRFRRRRRARGLPGPGGAGGDEPGLDARGDDSLRATESTAPLDPTYDA